MGRVLGLSSGSSGGSAEMCLKAALSAAEAAGHDVGMIRLDELRLPLGEDPTEVDDAEWYWEQLMACEALLLSAPIYSRTVPSKVKVIIDKVLGPNADAAIIRHLIELRARGEDPVVPFRLDERVLRPRVAGFIAVGGALTSQWKTLCLPIMHTMTLSMQIAVVDQFVVSGAGMPKSVVLFPNVIARCAQLGANVASQIGREFNDVDYLGDPGLCPMCHLDVVALNGRDIECATCGARGRLDAEAAIDWNDFSACIFTLAERTEHYEEILHTGASQRRQADLIQERAAAYSNYEPVLRPPR